MQIHEHKFPEETKDSEVAELTSIIIDLLQTMHDAGMSIDEVAAAASIAAACGAASHIDGGPGGIHDDSNVRTGSDMHGFLFGIALKEAIRQIRETPRTIQ